MYNSQDIHKGLDSMSFNQVNQINLGRIVQYSEELLNGFVELVEQADTKTEIRILTTISALSKRERLVIARAFLKIHLGKLLHITIQNPLMYNCNRYTDELFDLYTTMVQNNSNNINAITKIIEGISLQSRQIMSIGYSGIMMNGGYK